MTMKAEKIRSVDRNITASRIRALRKEKNITQLDLAKKLGIARSRISSWENGASLPEIGHIKYMSKLFGVPADYIIGTSNHRYNIKVPDYFEFDLTKLNSMGISMLHEFYKFLLNSEDYKNR